MRDAENVTVRLSDYQPPDYLIDEIALVFSLEPEATIVAARSHVRRSSAGGLDAAQARRAQPGFPPRPLTCNKLTALPINAPS